MTDLFEKSIQILELPKVLERLAGQALKHLGQFQNLNGFFK